MFKRFCTIFIIFAFVLPLVAVLCMLLLWGLRQMKLGDVESVKNFITGLFRIFSFAGPATLVADATSFSPVNYMWAVANGFVKGFLSAFFVGGVMYLIDGFLGKKIYKDMTQILTKIFGLVVGALILHFTNLFNELTAIITRYTLVVIIIVLILILTRVLFMRQKAFDVMSVFKSLLKVLINAIATVILCCYLIALGSLAVADPVALCRGVLNVILVFLISGTFVGISLVADKLVAIDMR